MTRGMKRKQTILCFQVSSVPFYYLFSEENLLYFRDYSSLSRA